MNIDEGVQAFLLAQPGITSIVGRFILGDMAPKTTPYPRLVYSLVDTTDQKQLAGTVNMSTSRYSVDAWARTRSGAATLAKAVRDAVKAWIDLAADDRTPWGTVYVQAVSLEDMGNQYDPPQDAGDVGAYRSTVDLLIWYGDPSVIIVGPTVTVLPGTPIALPLGTVGSAYSQTLSASGGTGPYSFAVTGGSLPAGLTLTGSGVNAGLLSGTP